MCSVIKLSRVDGDWVVGELRGKKGMFPVNFIDKVPENLPKDSDEKSSEAPAQSSKGQSAKTPAAKQGTGQCEAVYDFDGDTSSGELSFTTGEKIDTIEWVNSEWLSGRIGSREGIFPATFVKIIKEIPKQNLPKANLKQSNQLSDDLLPKAEATFEFTAGNDEEISLKEGDKLNLLDRVGDGWYMGENMRTGQIGNFPVNFVNVIVPLP